MSREAKQRTRATAGGATTGQVTGRGSYPTNPDARYPFEPPFGEKGMGPDQLEAIGEIETGGSQVQGAVLVLIPLIAKLKARRESLGLSLTDVSERANLTRQVVSKLENGHTINPTLATLYRYAMAVGATITMGVEEIEED